MLGETWCSAEILLLSPRRLAARAAAERMAELSGERVGDTIGYATRLDSKRSRRTRITVLTEGIFLKRIQADPELAGVSAVLFDEVHERSLDSDFGLALALDAQAALRPDLRLLAMSATLDGARFSQLMGGAPVIESHGRSHEIEIVHLGRSAGTADRRGGRRRLPPRAGREPKAGCSPSFREWPRSSGPRRGSAPFPPASTSILSTAASIRPRSALPLPHRRRGGASSCSPPRSPKPA